MIRVVVSLTAAAALAACATDPKTGETRTAGARAVVALQYLQLGASLLDVLAGEEAPQAVNIAASTVERGIATYCALPEADQATVRRDLEPGVRAYVASRHGGRDGDICTDD